MAGFIRETQQHPAAGIPTLIEDHCRRLDSPKTLGRSTMVSWGQDYWWDVVLAGEAVIGTGGGRGCAAESKGGAVSGECFVMPAE